MPCGLRQLEIKWFADNFNSINTLLFSYLVQIYCFLSYTIPTLCIFMSIKDSFQVLREDSVRVVIPEDKMESPNIWLNFTQLWEEVHKRKTHLVGKAPSMKPMWPPCWVARMATWLELRNWILVLYLVFKKPPCCTFKGDAVARLKWVIQCIQS